MTSFSVDKIFDKKLVIFTGKGGIGKSLVTAALGQIAAERGLRTLLIERSEQEQLAPLFGHAPVGHNEVEIAENLFCINLDQTRCFEEYVVKQLGQKKLFEKVFSNNVVKTFLNTIPGLGESMLLGRMFYTCELADPLPYDLVLFDAPASGHMQNLMTTPQAIIDSGIGGPLVREITRVRDFLATPEKVATVVVTVPEELIISELVEFLPKLQKDSPANIIGVVVNRTVSASELEQLESYAQSIPSDQEDLQDLAQFLLNQDRRSVKNQMLLLKSLKKIIQADSSPVEALFLPDLGSIAEPLPKGFGQEFFKESSGDD